MVLAQRFEGSGTFPVVFCCYDGAAVPLEYELLRCWRARSNDLGRLGRNSDGTMALTSYRGRIHSCNSNRRTIRTGGDDPVYGTHTGVVPALRSFSYSTPGGRDKDGRLPLSIGT